MINSGMSIISSLVPIINSLVHFHFRHGNLDKLSSSFCWWYPFQAYDLLVLVQLLKKLLNFKFFSHAALRLVLHGHCTVSCESFILLIVVESKLKSA
jgi:hypothetical protein